MNKALIVSPYLDHLGGGERYILTLASVLETLNYEITFAWDNLEEITTHAKMLGISLKHPTLDPVVMVLYHASNPLKMYLETQKYDLTVYLSDGSLPLLGSKRNLIHMQVPFHNVGGKSLKNQIKKLFCHKIIVNSNFTKSIVDKEYGVNSTVLYPPTPLLKTNVQKENIILSVGRFEPSLNIKKQDILISAFKKLSDQEPSWRLILAGASSSDKYLENLRELAVGYPIEFALNISYEKMVSLYSRSAIYWHAAGYGVDQEKNPELTEHFGISTVEAISSGCVPLVVGKGGQVEIIDNSELYWGSCEELIEKTKKLINLPNRQNLIKGIDLSSFSHSTFCDQLTAIINQ